MHARSTPQSSTNRRGGFTAATAAARKRRACTTPTQTASQQGVRPTTTAKSRVIPLVTSRKVNVSTEQETSVMGKREKQQSLNNEEAQKRPKVGESEEGEEKQTVEAYIKAQAAKLEEAVLDAAKQRAQQLKETFDEEKQAMLESIQNRINQEQVAQKKSAKELISVEVSITEGPHTGFERTLKLQQQQQRSIAKVGRSTGKLFEDYGISLPHDGEVSTTHGKFKVKQGCVYFEDCGSTNGTIIKFQNQEEQVAEPHAAVQLSEGDQVLVGQSLICIHNITKTHET